MLAGKLNFPQINNISVKSNPISTYNTRNISFAADMPVDKFDKKYPYLVKGNPDDFSREKVVSIYCSSDKIGYDNAYDLGKRIAESPKLGGVLTGGTVGLMEAVNKGCYEAGGYSIGVSEKTLEAQQPPNNYLHEHHSAPDSANRENLYNKRSAYTVVLPGGPGTMAETFNKLVYLLKDKFFKEKEPDSDRFQHMVILVDDKDSKGMWKGLYKWLNDYPVKVGYFSKRSLAHIKVVSSNEEAIKMLEKGIDYDPLKDQK
jgi:uncharacterized protein (TIGR00730 family)